MLLLRLEPSDERPPFSCGIDDLDEYYRVDSIRGGEELLAVTYLFYDIDDESERDASNLVAFYSVSNDSIKREDVPRSTYERLAKVMPREKRYSSLPAVKIGRLGINNTFQGQGIGSRVLDYLKGSFTIGNKTGCRFLIVDAYNKPEVIRFYRKNGFQFLLGKDEAGATTRLMYYDLIQVTDGH